jgi:anti-anti-sigma factor
VSLQISIRQSGNVTIVDVRGISTLDEGESELLRSNLERLVAGGVRKALLNLADVTQLDSSGVMLYR